MAPPPAARGSGPPRSRSSLLRSSAVSWRRLRQRGVRGPLGLVLHSSAPPLRSPAPSLQNETGPEPLGWAITRPGRSTWSGGVGHERSGNRCEVSHRFGLCPDGPVPRQVACLLRNHTAGTARTPDRRIDEGNSVAVNALAGFGRRGARRRIFGDLLTARGFRAIRDVVRWCDSRSATSMPGGHRAAGNHRTAQPGRTHLVRIRRVCRVGRWPAWTGPSRRCGVAAH